MGDSHRISAPYERPFVTDYGTLVELTASSMLNNVEDGVGKNPGQNTDGSSVP